MIDKENPVAAVPGRIKEAAGRGSQNKKTKVAEADKKAKLEEESSRRDRMLEGMGKKKRQEFEAKEL